MPEIAQSTWAGRSSSRLTRGIIELHCPLVVSLSHLTTSQNSASTSQTTELQQPWDKVEIRCHSSAWGDRGADLFLCWVLSTAVLIVGKFRSNHITGIHSFYKGLNKSTLRISRRISNFSNTRSWKHSTFTIMPQDLYHHSYESTNETVSGTKWWIFD